MPTEFMPTTQPPDWVEAFKAEARRRGVSLSAYVGDRCKQGLPREVQAHLSNRPPVGGKKPKGKK